MWHVRDTFGALVILRGDKHVLTGFSFVQTPLGSCKMCISFPHWRKARKYLILIDSAWMVLFGIDKLHFKKVTTKWSLFCLGFYIPAESRMYTQHAIITNFCQEITIRDTQHIMRGIGRTVSMSTIYVKNNSTNSFSMPSGFSCRRLFSLI